MFVPIETGRLIIRCPRPEDLEALHARRNEPQVARYQNWSVPHPRHEAEQMLTGAIAQGGPLEGQWWMITVADRTSGEVFGDLALRLSEDGNIAELGYTFGSEYWGNGYAAEAAEGLLHHLFADRGIQRLYATMDPDNEASVLVAERIGLVYEGRTRLSYWEGTGDAAVGSDDLYYGLTREDWERWVARQTGPPDDVRLIEVTPENQRAVRQLATHKSQERFVSPVASSYGDALFPPSLNGGQNVPLLRAIEADGQLAGFIMLALATEYTPEPYLWRLLIDRVHQRRGIGGRAVELVEDLFRSQGHQSMLLTWAEGRGTPAQFYLSRGFKPTGRLIDGEIEARKMLT